jgi:glycogen(starch) synthase
MKICHLIYDDVSNPWLGGGGAVRALEIYRRLASDHEITLVTGMFPGGGEEDRIDGVRILRVGSDRSYARSRLAYCRQAVDRLRSLEWDVWVHEFSAFAPLRVPSSLRNLGILFFYHFVGAHAMRKHPLVGGVSWLAEYRTLRSYRRILTISPSMQDTVRARLGERQVDLSCVYTGIDSRYFELDPEEGSYLLYFGRTDIHTKGLDLLIRSFARIAPDYPGLSLKLAGRGTEQAHKALEKLIAQANIGDRVQIEGAVDDSRKGELLRRALFVCAPSRYEGWCIVAVEAAACGKAVVGTRIDGLRDAVRDGETGLLVESGNVLELATGMRRLLDDSELRKSCGKRGREWARRFDWDSIAHRQEAILEAVADENRTGPNRSK